MVSSGRTSPEHDPFSGQKLDKIPPVYSLLPGRSADRDTASPTVPPSALPPADRILVGLVTQGHPREAIRLYLAIADADLRAQVARLGLPAPVDRPLRKPGGRNPWQLAEVHRLVTLWQSNVHGSTIAEAIGRSPGGVRAKARRLGLYRRDRTALVRELPAAPPACKPRHQIAWTETMETELAERWFANFQRRPQCKTQTILTFHSDNRIQSTITYRTIDDGADGYNFAIEESVA